MPCRARLSPLLLALSLGCAGGEKPPADGATLDEDGVIDATLDYGATDASLVFEPPAQVLQPYTDTQSCWFTTYTGEDVGVVSGRFLQSPDYGHHVIVMRTNADPDRYPDGEAFDCTEADALDMTDMEPFVLPDEPLSKGTSELHLPEGMANKLKANTRLLVQSHHINYEDTPIRVNDRIELNLVPIDEVSTFAAPLVHTSTTFALPPGPSELTLTCAFEQDVSFLYVLGHMHEWGTAVTVDYNKADGTTERLYEVPEWSIAFRDLPPITRYDEAPLSVKAGETFTTTCAYNNDTDAVIGFPEEMCVMTGIVYPLTVPMICDVEG